MKKLLERPTMNELRELFTDMSTYIATQNRDILDMTLQTRLVEEALSFLPHRWFQTACLLIYARRDVDEEEDAEELTALEAYRRWGGTAMETARERRWWHLPQDHRPV
ncbi:MAG: hypothetical protein H6839_01500 [Planctomycetes bacterium]|nr:hypothetical protein [Planctomycetota bacterium]